MGYKWLNGYSTSLNAKLSSTDRILPIDDAKTLSQTLDADHSYLVINDGTGAEIVKVISFGHQVKIERGQDGTEAKTFPSGSCVKWEVTKQGMTETVCNSDFKCCDLDDCGCN
ncbi:hypothetical protein [Lonepinella sp. BR2474]|uniref:hypothetical protein n=1 Tax=Lonepinella sp. BR2474 TaxID=3434548 RepID=UPI003F6DE6C8